MAVVGFMGSIRGITMVVMERGRGFENESDDDTKVLKLEPFHKKDAVFQIVIQQTYCCYIKD